MTNNNHRVPQFSIGIDMELIDRFENVSLESHTRLLNRIFSARELNYCFSKVNPAPCLCGCFCAKEAIIKAFSSLHHSRLSFPEIEIVHDDKSGPKVNIIGEKFTTDFLDNIEIKISIAHTAQVAVSNALVILWCDR